MNKILEIDPKYKDIAIGLENWIDLILGQDNVNLIDFSTQDIILKSGLMGQICGRNLWLCSELTKDYFRVSTEKVNDSNNAKWSVDIKFDDVDKVERILNLQPFM